MKYYYALFKEADCVEVEFPDLPGCVTFGTDWDEALRNAKDALTVWLANADIYSCISSAHPVPRTT